MASFNSSNRKNFPFNNEDFVPKSGNVNFDETLQSEILNETDSRGLQDDDIIEETNEMYLSLIWTNNHLGASYYDSNRQIIFHLDDIQESNKFEIIYLLIADLKPICVIVSAKTDEILIKYLKENIDENRILLVANNDYNYEHGKKRIMQLKLKKFLKLNITDDTERYIYFSSFLNFESVLMIRSIGALLKYLDKNRIGVQLEEMTIHTPIVTFKSIKLDDILLIDQNSLRALQVFHSVSHPSAYKQNSKEGLSLFNIYLKQIQTKLGVLKLRSWLLKPTRNENILNKRHEIIEFFMDPRNQDNTQRISSYVRNCKNMNLVFKRLKNSQPNVSDWTSLYRTTENIIKLITICDQLTNNQQRTTLSNSHDVPKLNENNLFEKFAENNNIDYFRNLNDIFNLLIKTIDFKKMSECKQFCVLTNIDEELDNKRILSSNLTENLAKIADKESERLKIRECSVLFISQLGFLLVISHKEMDENSEERAKFEFESELKLVFSDEEKYFYKNKLMLYLDNKFGDLETEINNIQRKIMYELQTAISEYNYVYAYLIDLCSELDVCLAFSKVAIENSYVKPIFDKDKTCFIYARQTRHPLLQLVVDSFVPNDVISGLIPNIENQHELIDETNTVKVLRVPRTQQF
jgi:DNA mismatch repair protein MSH5